MREGSSFRPRLSGCDRDEEASAVRELGQALSRGTEATAYGGFYDGRLIADRRQELQSISEHFYRQYCYDPDWIKANPNLYEKRVQESINTRRPARTVALQQRAIGKYDVRSELPSLPASLPVLVIHGDQDVAVYPAEKEEILKGIGHATLAKCPRSDFGHNWLVYIHRIPFVLSLTSSTTGTTISISNTGAAQLGSSWTIQKPSYRGLIAG